LENKNLQVKLVIILSALGMLSVLITIISDFLLLGKPDSAVNFFIIGTETMWDIDPWRITLGTFIGVFALPFQLLGLLPLYFALKPAGRILPIITVIGNAHALLIGVAFHMSYAYIGRGWALYHQNDISKEISSKMMDSFSFYWLTLLVIMSLEILLSSLVYIILVIKRKTLFPKWMAIFSQIVIILITFTVLLAFPYPIGGYIAPASINVATLIFFMITRVRYIKCS
jgi:hypothetical protein